MKEFIVLKKIALNCETEKFRTRINCQIIIIGISLNYSSKRNWELVEVVDISQIFAKV